MFPDRRRSFVLSATTSGSAASPTGRITPQRRSSDSKIGRRRRRFRTYRMTSSVSMPARALDCLSTA
ncbi:hypothetical protein PAA26_03460 [Methanomassiliicoccaceae archaeon COG_1]|nr:hypothetical protein [Methanomassiliicoccaceae archaeon COG_1]